jgi:hypothetical protein
MQQGYCSSYINNYFVWNTNGLNSSDSSSSAFIDGIFRTESSAGSSHRGGILLSDIEAQQAGSEAAKLAYRWRKSRGYRARKI